MRRLRVTRPPGLVFEAGQHIKLGVAGGKRTSFSIASAPHEPDIDLAVELRPGGRVTPGLFALRIGDVVELDNRAKGNLRLAASGHHLMIATVTGIAPLRSLLRAALHRGTTDRFTILHGASHADELVFRDELLDLAAHDTRIAYHPTISRPGAAENAAWTGATGRVDGLARQLAGALDPATTHVYAVGHAGMIDAVRKDLGGLDFAISTESYG